MTGTTHPALEPAPNCFNRTSVKQLRIYQAKRNDKKKSSVGRDEPEFKKDCKLEGVAPELRTGTERKDTDANSKVVSCTLGVLEMVTFNGILRTVVIDGIYSSDELRTS